MKKKADQPQDNQIQLQGKITKKGEIEMTRKTYYSVVFGVWGADKPGEAWFDNKKEAEEFADHDYRDNPVAHHVSKAETIKEYDEYVAWTKYSGY